jgi:RNA polymerase sigma-70 factor (ECF subfamily)
VEGSLLDFSVLDDAALMAVIASSFGKPAFEAMLDEALRSLYERFGRLVFSVAYHLLGDNETAEEITQDVFVKVCYGAEGYRAELSKVSTWLVSITRHRAIDELRKRSARPEKDLVNWPEDMGQERRDGLNLAQETRDDLQATLESAMQEGEIRRVLASLPMEQQQVLGLAFFHGMSHSQIAGYLGEPLGTVKSRVRLAMLRLRDAFSESGMMDS